jgi:hypothetical protein
MRANHKDDPATFFGEHEKKANTYRFNFFADTFIFLST